MCILCVLFVNKSKFGDFVKKNDIFVVISLVILSIVLYFCFSSSEKNGDIAVIYADGAEYARLPLAEDAEINVAGTNVVCTKGGQVFMKSADCPDKLCVHQAPVSSSGRDIVCLPNKVIIRVISDKSADTDAIAR